MTATVDEYFRQRRGKRLSFTGGIDEIRPLPHKIGKLKQNQGKIITFTNVCETNTERYFRDHVHVIIANRVYNKFFNNLSLDEIKAHFYQFEAEIYSYTHKPRYQYNSQLQHAAVYQELGVGLRNPTGIKPIAPNRVQQILIKKGDFKMTENTPNILGVYDNGLVFVFAEVRSQIKPVNDSVQLGVILTNPLRLNPIFKANNINLSFKKGQTAKTYVKLKMPNSKIAKMMAEKLQQAQLLKLGAVGRISVQSQQLPNGQTTSRLVLTVDYGQFIAANQTGSTLKADVYRVEHEEPAPQPQAQPAAPNPAGQQSMRPQPRPQAQAPVGGGVAANNNAAQPAPNDLGGLGDINIPDMSTSTGATMQPQQRQTMADTVRAQQVQAQRPTAQPRPTMAQQAGYQQSNPVGGKSMTQQMRDASDAAAADFGNINFN